MRRQRLSGGQCCQFCPAVWKRSLQQFGSRQILLRCPRIPTVGVPAHGKILHRWATLDNSQHRWRTELRIVTGRRNAARPSGRGFSYEALIPIGGRRWAEALLVSTVKPQVRPIQVNCGSTGNRTCIRHPQPDASSVESRFSLFDSRLAVSLNLPRGLISRQAFVPQETPARPQQRWSGFSFNSRRAFTPLLFWSEFV